MAETDLEEPGIEGILKQVLMDHRDSDANGIIVLVFEGNEAAVYSTNIKPEILEKIGNVLADTTTEKG